jgi:hypothetical protein
MYTSSRVSSGKSGETLSLTHVHSAPAGEFPAAFGALNQRTTVAAGEALRHQLRDFSASTDSLLATLGPAVPEEFLHSLAQFGMCVDERLHECAAAGEALAALAGAGAGVEVMADALRRCAIAGSALQKDAARIAGELSGPGMEGLTEDKRHCIASYVDALQVLARNAPVPYLSAKQAAAVAGQLGPCLTHGEVDLPGLRTALVERGVIAPEQFDALMTDASFWDGLRSDAHFTSVRPLGECDADVWPAMPEDIRLMMGEFERRSRTEEARAMHAVDRVAAIDEVPEDDGGVQAVAKAMNDADPDAVRASVQHILARCDGEVPRLLIEAGRAGMATGLKAWPQYKTVFPLFETFLADPVLDEQDKLFVLRSLARLDDSSPNPLAGYGKFAVLLSPVEDEVRAERLAQMDNADWLTQAIDDVTPAPLGALASLNSPFYPDEFKIALILGGRCNTSEVAKRAPTLAIKLLNTVVVSTVPLVVKEEMLRGLHYRPNDVIELAVRMGVIDKSEFKVPGTLSCAWAMVAARANAVLGLPAA